LLQAGKAAGDEMQEDIENLPASTVAAEECQQRKEGMQTRGENALLTLTTSPHECEHQRKLLLENKNILHESLKLKSQQYKGERNKVSMNVKIVAVSLDDVQNNSLVKKESLHNSEAYTCENFVPSGKDCGEQDSGLAQVIESRTDGNQEVSIYAHR
jgi:hypothetical protein